MRVTLWAAFVLGVALPAGLRAATVFDNTTTYSGTEHILLPAGAADSEEHGNEITLEGPERVATEFRFVVRIHGAGVAFFDYRLRFYANDGADGVPGTLLFESPVTHRVVDSGAPLPYTHPLPDVLVPDTFTWTLQLFDRSGNMAAFGPSLYAPPTVGSVRPGYWRWIGESELWQLVDAPEAPFGARLLAGPDAVSVAEIPMARPKIRVWPNPAKDVVLFDVTGSAGGTSVRIFNAAGELAGEIEAGATPMRWVPERRWASGVYFVSFGDAREGQEVRLLLLR